ncbi:uncharacterized protein LAJ45_02935 [Morchella importuna]|uniref:uncharacterized protein n=1 Tax=Morchella importuna TaxID=1174673 RepID=UPI001E8DAA5D|nr:uncharacterized protein LAJ45_02935 [Morchella importuna]KAH8152711.1 hypothetical protein LAJ45_02935 [Morchella importuna]
MVGDAVEVDRWAERLTSELLALGQVEKERVGGWSGVRATRCHRGSGEQISGRADVGDPGDGAGGGGEGGEEQRKANVGQVEGGPEDGEANTCSKMQQDQQGKRRGG